LARKFRWRIQSTDATALNFLGAFHSGSCPRRLSLGWP
jgi:hypothetical protein